MSGPFRRLARQLVNGPQNRIRATVRLPYAASPALLPIDDETISHQTYTHRTAPAEPSTLAPSPDPDPYRRVPGKNSYTGVSAPLMPERREAESPKDSEIRAKKEAVVSAAYRTPTQPAAEPPFADTVEALIPQTNATTEAGRAVSSPRRQHPATSQKEALLAVPAPIAAYHSPVKTGYGGSRTNATLVGQRIRGRQIASHRADTPGQPDEVHVHIGRIEVTAVQERDEPKRKRPTRSRRQPMSLDEYLAKRQRKP